MKNALPTCNHANSADTGFEEITPACLLFTNLLSRCKPGSLTRNALARKSLATARASRQQPAIVHYPQHIVYG